MNPLVAIAQHPRFAALAGAFCIAFSGIFYLWSDVSPSTGVVFRCLYGLPILLLAAWFERRELGPMSGRTIRISALAGIFFGIDLVSFHYVADNIGAGLATMMGNLQVVIVGARGLAAVEGTAAARGPGGPADHVVRRRPADRGRGRCLR